MTGDPSAGLRFVSWTRRGLIALSGADSGTITASASVQANGADAGATPPVSLALYGAGDVLGLDTTSITRRYPRPDTTDAQTEFFPLVEFSVPELPWLLPAPAGAGSPQPWLCLLTVAVGAGVTLTRDVPSRPMTLTITSPARVAEQLPDLAGAALWAHAWAPTTVTTGGADPVDTVQPAAVGARLLSPRRLLPDTQYLACLVPTLKAAALAGLGAAPDAVAGVPAGTPAWTPTDTAVALPAYDAWQFATGAAGDFESLARALVEKPVDDLFGSRPLDLGLGGPGLPDVTDTGWRFRGALTSPHIAAAAPWPGDDTQELDAALRAEVHAAAAVTAATGRPALGPLLYARAAAGRADLTASDAETHWFEALNRDPRLRSVAGLGSRSLRRDVEDVMARAWDQVGDVRAANAVLRRLQLSRALAGSLHERHLTALLPARLLGVARPVLTRVHVPAQVTGGVDAPHVLAAVAASALPAGGLWRGVTVALRAAASAHDTAARVVTGLLATGIPEPDGVPDGTLHMAPPSAVFAEAATAFVTPALNAAADTAGLPTITDVDPATRVAALDSLLQTGGTAVAAAAMTLAAQTRAAVLSRQLPPSVDFSVTGSSLSAREVLQHNPQLAAGALAAALLPVTTPPPIARMPLSPLRPGPVIPPVLTDPGTLIPPVLVTVENTDPRLAVIRDAVADAVSRFVRPGTSTALPAPTALDLPGTADAVLAGLHPDRTIKALADFRIPGVPRTGVDDVAEVMAGPVFGDPAYLMLVRASHEAFVPGLDSIPPDSVTLLATNPPFIAAYLAGLNSALGHELLWRDYPTDERGTYWHSFWGAGDDIGPLHRFSGPLASNVLSGTKPLLVLVLKGRLLRRYPDSDVYAILGATDATRLDTDPNTIIHPVFRDSVDPDITLVGFPLTLDEVTAPPSGQAYWFAIAEHPGAPRFGLVDPDTAVPHPPLPAWDELAWPDLGTAGATATYLPATAPPMAPASTTRHWGATSADMAAITYQPPVRVVLRATELLSSSIKPTGTPT